MADIAKPLPFETKAQSRVLPLQPHAEYDYDGNGKNNLNRFSLTSNRARAMDDRLDFANQTFLETRGLTSQEIFEGLPEGTVPSVTVQRGRYQDIAGTPLLIGHAANLHTAMHHPSLSRYEERE